MGKVSKDKRDIYYRLAKQTGYRSRSAFKILQIDDYFKFFENCKYIVDLCAAPGGWSQVAAEKLNFKNQLNIENSEKNEGKIISIDLQEMAPLDGVDILIGDITAQSTLVEILEKTEGNLIDLVMCDGAPDVTGFNEFDVHIQTQLILAALNISIRMLKEGGIFITKIFKGKHTNKILQILLNFFKKVTIAKPRACRNASFESFLVCQGFCINSNKENSEINSNIFFLRNEKLNENDIIYLNSLYLGQEIDLETLGVEFVQVGKDEYDSDKTYDLESTNYTTILKPLQAPINPPYKFYIDNLKGKQI
jgi:tRNA (cytidine32/guanosine34-2'-O)-methyltransferase